MDIPISVLNGVTILLIVICCYLYRQELAAAFRYYRSRTRNPKETLEENHDTLGKEEIDAILNDERLREYGETFALAALKRRLDFLDNKKHDSENFFIETERMGAALKIKWRFKSNFLPCYDLVGFRRTGGFFLDEWDESNNGTLVIHSSKDNESTELLNEGEAVYYTFFLKPWNNVIFGRKRSLLRFQVTLSTKGETEVLAKLIARLQESSFNPSRPPNITSALKELGSYVEFDNAIEQEEKMLARQIDGAGYGVEEKNEKLSRLREVVASIRDKYEQ